MQLLPVREGDEEENTIGGNCFLSVAPVHTLQMQIFKILKYF